MSCLPCDILEGRIAPPGGVIHEAEHWVVDHSISPVRLKGWLIIKPKRHCEHIAELTEKAAQASSMKANPISLTRDDLFGILIQAL